MTQVKQLDFNGRTIFCGIDVHKKNWRVNIQDTEFELEDFSQDPDARVLYKHLIQRYAGATFKACYEAQRFTKGVGFTNKIVMHAFENIG